MARRSENGKLRNNHDQAMLVAEKLLPTQDCQYLILSLLLGKMVGGFSNLKPRLQSPLIQAIMILFFDSENTDCNIPNRRAKRIRKGTVSPRKFPKNTNQRHFNFAQNRQPVYPTAPFRSPTFPMENRSNSFRQSMRKLYKTVPTVTSRIIENLPRDPKISEFQKAFHRMKTQEVSNSNWRKLFLDYPCGKSIIKQAIIGVLLKSIDLKELFKEFQGVILRFLELVAVGKSPLEILSLTTKELLETFRSNVKKFTGYGYVFHGFVRRISLYGDLAADLQSPFLVHKISSILKKLETFGKELKKVSGPRSFSKIWQKLIFLTGQLTADLKRLETNFETEEQEYNLFSEKRSRHSFSVESDFPNLEKTAAPEKVGNVPNALIITISAQLVREAISPQSIDCSEKQSFLSYSTPVLKPDDFD